MIEDLDSQLQDWARSLAIGVDVRLEPPADSGGAMPCVHLYLLDLLPDAPGAAIGRTPAMQIGLRYLVTTSGATPLESHRMLGTLVFAAMEHPEFKVELDPPAPAFWSALGVLPRPAFMLRVSLRQPRKESRAGPVRNPVEVRRTALTALEGVLLGPGERPVCNARIELGLSQLTAFTDASGRFRFEAVPAEPLRKRLQIRAKGYEQVVEVEQAGDASRPLIIHFEAMEA